MDEKTRKDCIAHLRALADQVDRGELDEVFTVAHSRHHDGTVEGFKETATAVYAGTNIGAVFAIDALAGRIDCCADTDCISGTMRHAVGMVMATFTEEQDAPEGAAPQPQRLN